MNIDAVNLAKAAIASLLIYNILINQEIKN